MEVKNAVKLKKESSQGWFAQGTNGNQPAKHVAPQVVTEAKTQIFREAVEEPTVTVEEMLARCPAPQAGEEVTCQHFVQCKWGAVDLNWG